MTRTAKQTVALTEALLRGWGDALARLQIVRPDEPALDGGISCPACGRIHGRCHEAAYPLLTLAARTGERKYAEAAKAVFRWGENMVCADGSVRNDFGSDWRGVTVFGAVALHDALFFHGSLLTDCEREDWEARLSHMGAWLYENLRPGAVQAYLNYYAANACAMALLGRYFDKQEYTALSRELAEFCLTRVSGNGLLFGEGHPLDVRTTKGSLAIDAGGYNPEETLPSLTRCALTLRDREMTDAVRKLWRAQLMFMLPDGAWDDSAGSRAFKWSYWGSRTADGCQEALFALGAEEPVFAEAALRNAALYARCTHDGLLYGGRDYYLRGEKACSHHTFCRAKAVAGALNGGLYDFEAVDLPSETAGPVTRYPELDLVRVTYRGWIADVSGYDLAPFPGAHASGGALSLLWRADAGPVVACGAADYTLKEPLNQQLPADAAAHRSACPRVETEINGVRYSNIYDKNAAIDAEENGDCVTVTVAAALCGRDGARLPGGECALTYRFAGDAVFVGIRVSPDIAGEVRFILPVVGEKIRPTATAGEPSTQPEPFYNLNPGFAGTEYVFSPDKNGTITIKIPA